MHGILNCLNFFFSFFGVGDNNNNDEEIEKTLAILIGLIAGVALLIVFLSCLRKLCEKGKGTNIIGFFSLFLIPLYFVLFATWKKLIKLFYFILICFLYRRKINSSLWIVFLGVDSLFPPNPSLVNYLAFGGSFFCFSFWL